MNVLIVDDERLLLWSLERLLAKHKISVAAVQSGEEALALLTKEPYDWLVTDLRLPGISGLDVLRFAKKTQPNIRTLIISAFGSGQLREELEKIGIDLYLDKPFNMDFLLETIRSPKSEKSNESSSPQQKPKIKMLSLL